VTEQEPDCRVQDVELKFPFPGLSDEKVTLPVGVPAEPVTVAVQVAGLPTQSGSGETTSVVVEGVVPARTTRTPGRMAIVKAISKASEDATRLVPLRKVLIIS